MIVPCLVLPLSAFLAGWAQPTTKSPLTIRYKSEALKPEPTWEETDTRVTTALELVDKNGEARLRHYSNKGGYTYRWYYNSRIEGSYKGKKQIFYSSTEANDWRCWFASSNGIDWNKHELRERFALRKLPAKATHLSYIVEAVAVKSGYSGGEAVGQKQIGQMRHGKNCAGYNSYSIGLKRPPS